jgi:hypothetical protein
MSLDDLVMKLTECRSVEVHAYRDSVRKAVNRARTQLDPEEGLTLVITRLKEVRLMWGF